MDFDRSTNIICEKPPALVRHIDSVDNTKGASPNKFVLKNVVGKDGPFVSVTFPSEWKMTKDPDRDTIKFLPPSVPDAGILFGTAERHPTEKSFSALIQLLKDADTGKVPKLLYEKGKTITPELRRIFDDIASAIGYDHVGGNQLTSISLNKEEPAPPYGIDKAEVVKLNGRNVLLIHGGFMADGKRYMFDQELFVPDLKYKQTYNICVYAKSKENYEKLVAPFEKTLNSVKWSSTE
jgi:hypothetical protein